MAEVQKPVAVPEPTVAEPAPVAPVVETPTIVEPTPAATETAEPAAATETTAVEEPKVEELKPVEPITSGILGYKAPGLVKSLIFSKKYFWVGDEAVPTASLTSYLRGEKPEVAHPTAAWSSQTGKGLLYFVKHADDKKTPAGVLNLSEASDFQKDGAVELSLKLHGHKHSFQAKTAAERDGWFLTLEKAIEEAKASAEGVKSSEGYKESHEKLSKPVAAVATAASTKEATPKKSIDVKPTEDGARAGSSSSSSDEEKKKEKKAKSKSRSASRKRQSIFGSLIGKKEEAKEKKEEKKEEKAEEKKEEEAVKAVDPIEPAVATPVPAIAAVDGTTETPVVVPAEETKPVEPVLAATEPAVEPEAKPKPAKRGSVFGSFFEKVRSPTTEKKEAEVAPVVPPKDEEAVVAKEETPAVVPAPAPEPAETAPAVLETAPVEETKAEEKAATPAKEKKASPFGKFFGSVKDKSKTPTEKATPKEETPKIDEEAPKIEEVPAVAAVEPIEPAVEAKADEVKFEEPKLDEPAKETTTPADTKEKRRSSFFGNLTSSVKKEKKTEGETAEEAKDEKHPSKLSSLFRNPSKAVKSKKDKEAAPKADETTETKEEKIVEPVAEEPKAEETAAAPEAPKVIGDVVPDAVTVGQAPTTTPTVQATA